MKTLGTLSMAVLLLLAAGSVRIYAQDADRPPQGQEEKAKQKDKDKDKDKGAMQEERRDKDQPNMKQDERRDRQEDKKDQRMDQRQDQKMDQRQDQKMDQRMERNEHQHPAAAKGKKIPDQKFKQSFGREHTVKVNRIITTTTIVPGQTQFVYAGTPFVFLDPWPAGWAFTDDCYIDFVDDEYVLVNPYHPGIYVTLMVGGGGF